MAEALVAILFISTALFGYLALHLRLIHSSTKLERRQFIRESAMHQLYLAALDARFDEVDLPSNLPSDFEAGDTHGYGAYRKRREENKNKPASPPFEPVGDYSDGEIRTGQESGGLPPGLSHVRARAVWTDRQGRQSFLIDVYERRALPAW